MIGKLLTPTERVELVLRAYRNGALSPADSLKKISLILSEETGEDVLSNPNMEWPEDVIS